jgi:hypothetical protein
MVRLYNILKHRILVSVLVVLSILNISKTWAQVNITTSSYTQNFGTANITGWVNNVTFPGWYIGAGTNQGYASNLPSSPNSYNGGGYYTYNCGNDAKIGSRASGSQTNLNYGVVLRNTTGQTIQSIRVSYTGYQMTLAQNQNNVNTLVFSYSVATTPPPVTGGGINVSALNFNNLTNDNSGNSNQLAYYNCTQSTDISACIPAIVSNNSYVILKWKDSDDGGNDHHMAIDDITLDFGITAADCSILLPVELMDFYAVKNNRGNDILWKVGAEENIDYYQIEKSNNGIDFSELYKISFNGNSGSDVNTYSTSDEQPFDNITYYRLSAHEKNGQLSQYRIIYVDENTLDWKSNCYQKDEEILVEFRNSIPNNSVICLFDLSGKLLAEEIIKGSQTKISTTNFSGGIYFLTISTAYKTENMKLIIQK